MVNRVVNRDKVGSIIHNVDPQAGRTGRVDERADSRRDETGTRVGGGEGLHEAVARNAAARADAIAIISSRSAITYEKLDSEADAWAAQLVAAGIGVGDRVPIMLPRSAELVIALLAVLKTGAAYALLDSAWPSTRLHAVVEELDARLLVGEQAAVAGLAVWTPNHGARDAPARFRPVSVAGSHACCVFFTSGTTGRPKGVLTPHVATSRLFRPGTFARFDTSTVIPLAAPTPWDAFSLELWGALLNGGTSVIVEEPFLSSDSLRTTVARCGVDTVWLTSSLFNMIVDEDLDAFSGVCQLLIGGERLSPTHVARFLRRHPEVSLLNGYGPVESTVFATTHRIRACDCERSDGIPLGRPVPGTRVFVLDGTRPCAVGETGEICIAGDGLALRYLGDAALTDARFPTVEIGGERLRLYRTGDLGHSDAEGLLHFRGRADRQLKIRGHRVEPAEVERQVELLLPSVRSCRVLACRDEAGVSQELVAFCIPREQGDGLDGAMETLRSALVSHHRPSAVISVSRFPVTAQGKLDEAALLALVEASADWGEAERAELDRPTGRLLAETFAAVLGRAAVPVDVSFFKLGGNSLGAGRVCARVAARLGRSVPVSWLYEQPTVTGLAAKVAAAARRDAPREFDANAGEVPLTPMQLVFLTRRLADPADRAGHCLSMWELRGKLDRGALAAAVAAVHRRHEPLRAAYLPDPRPVARLVGVPAPPLEVLPAAPSLEAAAATLREELAADLELLEGEVWRVALAPVGRGDVTLLGWVVHHIAFDGWSEAILADEMRAAYAVDLPSSPPRSTLRDAYVAHVERLACADVEAQRERVRAELADLPELCWPDGPVEASTGPPGHHELIINPAVLAAVDAVAAARGVTPFVVLLHRWARSVAAVTAQNDLAIGVPVAQRTAPELERAIGCHINMVCLRLRGDSLAGGADGLAAAARAVGRAFAAQDVPFPEVMQLAGSRRSGRPPVFQTLFSLHDNAPARLEFAGLRARFLPQPYVDLPLELVADLWPDDEQGLRVVVSYRREVVPKPVAHACALRFHEELRALPLGRRR